MHLCVFVPPHALLISFVWTSCGCGRREERRWIGRRNSLILFITRRVVFLSRSFSYMLCKLAWLGIALINHLNWSSSLTLAYAWQECFHAHFGVCSIWFGSGLYVEKPSPCLHCCLLPYDDIRVFIYGITCDRVKLSHLCTKPFGIWLDLVWVIVHCELCYTGYVF